MCFYGNFYDEVLCFNKRKFFKFNQMNKKTFSFQYKVNVEALRKEHLF